MESGNQLRISFALFFSIFCLAALAHPASASDANMSVTVERIGSSSSMAAAIILGLVTLALAIVLVLLIRYILAEKRKKRALREKVERMDTDEAEYARENMEEFSSSGEKPAFDKYSDVDKYLKEDERRIVDILRQREGICSQGTLRVVGNFSKATLSRLLKELEERNVIKKEQRGKKNLVILK